MKRVVTALLFASMIVPVGTLFSACTTTKAETAGLVDFVDTRQGTHSVYELSRGNTYPTTAMPWGMNFWTPQTGANRNGWIYRYAEDEIRGFRQTHQCSPWAGDYAAFSLMPVAGELKVSQNERAAGFSHCDEIAKPHYYSVGLKNGIKAEMSPTERGVFMRYSFPKGEDSYIIVDANNDGSMVKIFPEENRIIGYCKNVANNPRTGNFANYFVIEFDKPFQEYGTWVQPRAERGPDGQRQPAQPIAINKDSLDAEDDYVGAYIKFRKGATVNVKVASSFISLEQAELNLSRELGDARSLETIKTRAAEAWNAELGKMVVETDVLKDKETFYSCFFRSMLFPRKFYEHKENGDPYYYSPYDGKVYDGYMYTDNGFWDTFRAQFPLNIVLHPEMHGRYLQSLLDAYDQSGWLPSWSAPGHSGGMIGNHAFSLLADGWVKGVRTFDPLKATEAMYHDANDKARFGQSIGRQGAKEFSTLGYLPADKYPYSTAQTLEFAYDDWCALQIAQATEKQEYIKFFADNTQNFRNVYDPARSFMRGKNENGRWAQSAKDFDPIRWGGEFIEGNAWHYHWSVMHDTQALIDMMGGDEAFTAKLDSVFSLPNIVNVGTYGFMIHEMTEMVLSRMGQYAHGNQPVHHMIYLYNYAGQPWKTQRWAREVMRRLYNAGPEGYCGDEDQGQMSAWYVISAMGLYSVAPGTDEYVIGSPAFPKMTVSLENGNTFTVTAIDNSPQNVYIQDAKLNGQPLDRTYLTYEEIMNGGEVVYTMGPRPSGWGTDYNGRPYSQSKYKR